MADPIKVDFGDRLPTPAEINSAAGAMTAIETNREDDGTLVIGDAILSESLVNLVSDLFSIVARVDTVIFAPLSRQLTTQEAADFLNVSRPYLIKLINKGDLQCEMVGTHRRLSLQDVLKYKSQRSMGRKSALDEMQSIAEELGE